MKYFLSLIFILFATFCSVRQAGSECQQGQQVSLKYCYDGDTCYFEGLEDSVRLEGIDTAEKSGLCREKAIEAKNKLEEKIKSGKQVCLVNEGTGKYGRIIGKVIVDGDNINQWMVKNDFAVKYGNSTCQKKRDKCMRNYTCNDFDSICEILRLRNECDKKFGLDGDKDGVPCESKCCK